MSGVNAWMSDNLQHFNGDGTVDAKQLVFSKGSIGKQSVTSCSANSGNNAVKIDWDVNDIPTNGLATDFVACVVITDENQVLAHENAHTVQRADGEYTVSLDEDFDVNVDTFFHLIFVSEDGLRQSEDKAKKVLPAV